MEHDLVALVSGVQGVGACRVSYRKEVIDSKSQVITDMAVKKPKLFFLEIKTNHWWLL